MKKKTCKIRAKDVSTSLADTEKRKLSEHEDNIVPHRKSICTETAEAIPLSYVLYRTENVSETLDDVFLDGAYGVDNVPIDGLSCVFDNSPSTPFQISSEIASCSAPSVPIPRKPDYLPYSLVQPNSDSGSGSDAGENSDNSKRSVADSNPDTALNSDSEATSGTATNSGTETSSGTETNSGTETSSDVETESPDTGSDFVENADFSAPPVGEIISPLANAKKWSLERRRMLIPIKPEDLNDYDIDFIMRDDEKTRAAIQDMCHSLRFWLAAKFCANLPSTRGLKKPGVLTQKAICLRLGIDPDNFKSKKSSISTQSPADFGGLSPVEYASKTRHSQIDVIRDYASNLDDPCVKSILEWKKGANPGKEK